MTMHCIAFYALTMDSIDYRVHGECLAMHSPTYNKALVSEPDPPHSVTININQSESKDRHVDLRIKKERKNNTIIIYITVRLTICVIEI